MSIYFESAVEKVTKKMQEEIIDTVREMDFLKSINTYQPIDYETYLKVYSNTSLRKDAEVMGGLLQGTFSEMENCRYSFRNYLMFTWKDFCIEIPPGNDSIFIYTDPCYYSISSMERIKVLMKEVLPKLEKFCNGLRGAKIRQFCSNEFCHHDFENLQELYNKQISQEEKETEDMEK